MCPLNLEIADWKKQQLTTTAQRRCENEHSYTVATAEDTRSGTNKKELELEVYSEGFVYKWYYDGCVNRLCHMGDSHKAVWNYGAVWGLCGMYWVAESEWSRPALERLYMFLVNAQFCVLLFLYFDCISFPRMQKKAVATNWP